MQFLRSNTAVIVAVGPFYDATDGVTIETALTITDQRITLVAETDAGSAPTNILDNVTGATSGTANDLNYITGNDAGMMQMELAAADVNRVGRMTLSITNATNHVPVVHDYFVLPAALYDWLTGVIVPLPANITHAAGTAWASGAITAASIADAAIDRATFAADTGLQTIRSNTAQAGTATTITLDAGASAADGFYASDSILTTGGTGAGQFAVISSYVGSTKVATVNTTWVVNPDSTTTFAIFPAAETSADMAVAVWQYAQRVLTAATNLTTALATPTNITAGTLTTVQNVTTVNDKTGYRLSAMGVDDVWDEVTSGHTTAGSYGDKLGAHLPSVLKGLTTGGSSTLTVVMNATTGIDGGVPSAVDDFYNGCLLVFTSGALAGQRTLVEDYAGSTKTLTVTALTAGAASGVTFILV